MNRLEMIYQDGAIEIYLKLNLLTHEYYMSIGNKIIARYYYLGSVISCMNIEVKKVRFEDLKKFHEVVMEHYLKSL
ncbi:MAG: hypothetical protein QXI16_01295 [Sulfolobaceae archaeon]